MKFLLLIVLVVAVLLVLRKVQGSRKSVQPPPASRDAEQMVKCAHCGVNQPVSESILTHGRYFCCRDHLLQAESRQE
jgi:uncharacterized protein